MRENCCKIFIWTNIKTFVSSRSSVLLLAPLLAEADPAPRHVSRPTGSAGAQGTDSLCAHFRWMAEHVPAFRVPGTHIHILTSPDQFYQTMKVSVTVTMNVLVQLQRNDKENKKQNWWCKYWRFIDAPFRHVLLRNSWGGESARGIRGSIYFLADCLLCNTWLGREPQLTGVNLSAVKWLVSTYLGCSQSLLNI